jgi:hypothetical protein
VSRLVASGTPVCDSAVVHGRTLAFDQPGQEQTQAMLVDNFR